MASGALLIAVAALSSAQAENVLGVEDITNPVDVLERVASFEKSLRESGIPGRIRKCTTVVDVSEGRVSSNHSYGGICAIEFGRKAKDYIVCDDNLVGHFALTSSFAYDRNSVSRFVKGNCTGG